MAYDVLSVTGLLGAHEAGSVSPGDNNDNDTHEGLNGLLDETAWTRAGIGAGDDAATDGASIFCSRLV